ncbi:hypothetical protein TYRP_023240 [Tyrophagus putrescentiae]|nr:hypothetical protein TYRP_023240 [Tyrophagus putrescentiae]
MMSGKASSNHHHHHHHHQQLKKNFHYLDHLDHYLLLLLSSSSPPSSAAGPSDRPPLKKLCSGSTLQAADDVGGVGGGGGATHQLATARQGPLYEAGKFIEEDGHRGADVQISAGQVETAAPRLRAHLRADVVQFDVSLKGQWLFCVYPKRLFLTISAIDESVAVPEDRQRGILLANLLLRNKLN